MPIQRDVNHSERLVTATLHGAVTDADIFAYQREIWSRKDLVGYDELIEVDALAKIEFVSSDRVTELAIVAGTMDAPGHATKLAIVAVTDLHFGLARMYQAKRENVKRGAISVRVFRSRLEASQWLGRESH